MWWKFFIVGGLLGSLAFQTLTTSAEQREPLGVPYLSQFDGSKYASSDCGPASVAMAIAYATGEKVTPLQVRQAIIKLPGGAYAANPDSGTAIGDLARVARAHDLETFMGDGAASTGWGPERIRQHLGQGHPVIVLTRLAYLPGYSQSAQVDHYVILTGATASGYVYNDPALPNGSKRSISEKQLQSAQRMSGAPGQGAAFSGPLMAAASVSLSAPVETHTVTIAAGDTLWKLAQRYGASVAQLVSLNRDVVRNADHIEVGQVLQVPAPRESEGMTAQAIELPGPQPQASPAPAPDRVPRGLRN